MAPDSTVVSDKMKIFQEMKKRIAERNYDSIYKFAVTYVLKMLQVVI